jgi:hypothetical protein
MQFLPKNFWPNYNCLGRQFLQVSDDEDDTNIGYDFDEWFRRWSLILANLLSCSPHRIIEDEGRA